MLNSVINIGVNTPIYLTLPLVFRMFFLQKYTEIHRPIHSDYRTAKTAD